MVKPRKDLEFPVLNPRLLWAAAENMSGMAYVVSELVRNEVHHGGASRVWIETNQGRGVRPEDVEVRFIGNGIGFSKDRRVVEGAERLSPQECFVSLGNTFAFGTGSGARLSAATVCQVLEVISVPKDDPKVCYRIALHLPTFLDRVVRGEPGGTWETVRREETPFPEQLEHGTVITLRDFRKSNADDPFNEALFDPKHDQARAERIRQYIIGMRSTEIIRRVHLDGKQVVPESFEGFPLWSQKPPKVVKGLGKVSGELVLAEGNDARWCTIGGTNASVFFRTFLDDLREHAPALARELPPVLWDRRLTGELIVEILERYPSQSREHVSSAFYATSECAALVEYLASVVGGALIERLSAYESRPMVEQTLASLDRLIARSHDAQGIALSGGGPGNGVASGGPGDGTDERTPSDKLAVNRVTVVLESWDGSGERETGMFYITNPREGETFTWDDHGKRLIEGVTADGVTCIVHAIGELGGHMLDVQSEQYPERGLGLTLRCREPREREQDVFALVPSSTVVLVGEPKRIAVKREGGTSGTYAWSMHRARGGRAIAEVQEFTIVPGGRAIDIVPRQRGDYLVRCIDLRDATKVAECTVEVRERRVEAGDAAVDDPAPAGAGESGASDGGAAPYERTSNVGRQPWVFDGTTFYVVGAHTWDEAWTLEPRDRIISVSDAHPANSGARSEEERDLHLAWCLASEFALHRILTGVISKDDPRAWSSAQDKVLRSMFEEPHPAPAPGAKKTR